jgi:alginate O-acetyltransferase complex protein AlgI
MIFIEFRFIWFFLLAFLIYWAIKNNTARKVWLLICSYVFYGAWDWRFLSLILISTLLDYVVGLRLAAAEQEKSRRFWLTFSLVGNLGILGFFKYFNFFTESAIGFLSFLGIPSSFSTLHIILPIGISFYTFQTMSYSLDIFMGKLKATKNLLDLALFVGFFPQLVAGPIVRASTFLPQLQDLKVFSDVKVKSFLILFLIGFIKKACISDNLAPIADQYFANPELFNAASAWFAVVAATIQFYCDFSGYSDMAIACAGLLGYKLPQNFNFPYFASDITTFWKRWHMSLATWLRDYLYFPLERLRKRQKRDNRWLSYRNLVITMTACGLWHGAGWNFVIWGGSHGAALVFHREWIKWMAPFPGLRPVMDLLGPVITVYWFSLVGIFFRVYDFQDTMTVFRSFLFFESPGPGDVGTGLAWVIVPLVIAHWLAYRQFFANWYQHVPTWLFTAGYGSAAAMAIAFVPTDYSPFIYFQF